MTARGEYYRQDRAEVAPLLPPHYAAVLEIGCGEGSFRLHLRQDCEYWGIEPFPAAAQQAARRLDRVLTGTFQEVFQDLPDDYFDLIICNDVIEHFADHDAFLQDIKQKMASGACLVGSVPNVRYISNILELLIKKDWRYREEGILDKTHLRFFTAKSLRRTFQAHNYVIEAFIGFNKMEPGAVRTILKMGLTWIFGRDSQYWQFGFRLRKVR